MILILFLIPITVFAESNSVSEELVKFIFLFVTIMDIRIVYLINDKIISKLENKSYKFKHVKKDKSLKSYENLIKCPGCGASVSVNKGKCEYCGEEYNYMQEWYLLDDK